MLTWLAANATVGPAAAATAGGSLASGRVGASLPELPCRWADLGQDAAEVAESMLDPGKCPALIFADGPGRPTVVARDQRGDRAGKSRPRDQRPPVFHPLLLGGADPDPDTPTGV